MCNFSPLILTNYITTMGLLESIIRSAQQGGNGGGGLGDILEQLGRGGQSSTGNTLDEIQRQSTNAPAGSDISIDDLERQMGIGRGNQPYQQQPYQQPYQPQQQQPYQPQQQQPYQPQQPYEPQQQQPYPQPYPQETQVPQQQQQQGGGGLFGGGLKSILKVIGIGALAAFVLKRFTK